MALIVADRVVESSTTTGTGAFTLAAAYTGYRRFSAVCSTNDTVYYTIEAVDGNGNPSGDWETGLGTYSSANTLTRTSVSASSNANAAVNFAAGTKRVSLNVNSAHIATFYKSGGTDVALADGGTGASLIDPNADRLLFWDDSAGAVAFLDPGTGFAISGTSATLPTLRGALVKKSADQTAANYTAVTSLSWDSESYDTDGFHDNVTNNTRLTVPSGVSKVRLYGNVRIQNLTVDMWCTVLLAKNGSTTFDGATGQITEVGVAGFSTHLVSPPLDVTAGDYFELQLQVETDTSIDITASRSSFGIEVLA